MKIRKRMISAAVLAACAGIMVSGCSQAQPSLGQYAIVTGHGALSNQQVLNVAGPGQNIKNGSGTTTWYVYSDPRNYITGPGGDRGISTQLLTGITPAKGSAPAQPAIPVTVQSYIPFEVNPLIALCRDNGKGAGCALADNFIAFCLKYACATQTPQNDTSNASLAKSSTPGWEHMLNEIMPTAIDNSTREAIGNFPSTIWSDQAQWPLLAADIGKTLVQSLDNLDGASASQPFFCGLGSTASDCKPITNVQISKIIPPVAVQNAYGQGNSAVYQQQAAMARLNAAKILYGPDANWALAIMDIENQCPSKCTIMVGKAPIGP